MATRSDIIVQRTDGTFKRVYAHWDGYYKGNGAILQEHYNSQERAEALVEPGDISSLDARCDKPAGHTFDNRVKGCTAYYGRDRGERDTEGTICPTLDGALAIDGEEYRYVWFDGKWYGWGHDTESWPESAADFTPDRELAGILVRLKVAEAVED